MFSVFRFKQELNSSSLKPRIRQELYINLMCDNKISFLKKHWDGKLYILINIILKCCVWFSINFCETEKLSCEVLCLGLLPTRHFLLWPAEWEHRPDASSLLSTP